MKDWQNEPPEAPEPRWHWWLSWVFLAATIVLVMLAGKSVLRALGLIA